MIVRRETIKAAKYTQCLIPIGIRQYAIVDPEDYDELVKYRWRLRQSANCFYATRRVRHYGKEKIIKMHRQIMHTPIGFEVHHKNHNTLDNRKCNLENLTRKQHQAKRLYE